MTLGEYLMAYQGYRQRCEAEYRERWERTRWLATVIVSWQLKGSHTPQEVFPLPWDEEAQRPANEGISEEEYEERRQRAIAIMKQYE